LTEIFEAGILIFALVLVFLLAYALSKGLNLVVLYGKYQEIINDFRRKKDAAAEKKE
jgi:hypothetical protein